MVEFAQRHREALRQNKRGPAFVKGLESRINVSLKPQITSSPNNWSAGEAQKRQNTDIPALYVVLLISSYASWLRLRRLSLTHPL